MGISGYFNTRKVQNFHHQLLIITFKFNIENCLILVNKLNFDYTEYNTIHDISNEILDYKKISNFDNLETIYQQIFLFFNLYGSGFNYKQRVLGSISNIEYKRQLIERFPGVKIICTSDKKIGLNPNDQTYAALAYKDSKIDRKLQLQLNSVIMQENFQKLLAENYKIIVAAAKYCDKS